MKRTLLALSLFFLPSLAFAALPVGQSAPSVTLDGDLGGLVSGGAWNSESMKGKFTILFYVDPDEKTLNDEAADAFKAVDKDYARYGSVAIINMDATWLPNVAIQSSLEKKQKEFPNTVYVKDLEKHLVDAWGLGDDTSVITVFDPEGVVLFSKDGKLNAAEIQEVVEMTRKYAGK